MLQPYLDNTRFKIFQPGSNSHWLVARMLKRQPPRSSEWNIENIWLFHSNMAWIFLTDHCRHQCVHLKYELHWVPHANAWRFEFMHHIPQMRRSMVFRCLEIACSYLLYIDALLHMIYYIHMWMHMHIHSYLFILHYIWIIWNTIRYIILFLHAQNAVRFIPEAMLDSASWSPSQRLDRGIRSVSSYWKCLVGHWNDFLTQSC